MQLYKGGHGCDEDVGWGQAQRVSVWDGDGCSVGVWEKCEGDGRGWSSFALMSGSWCRRWLGAGAMQKYVGWGQAQCVSVWGGWGFECK